MHPRVLHQRSDSAHLRILDAAAALTERAGLSSARETLAAARDRDPEVSRMQEREAIADLLEALVKAGGAAPPAAASAPPTPKPHRGRKG